jgi:hypothetical protein
MWVVAGVRFASPWSSHSPRHVAPDGRGHWQRYPAAPVKRKRPRDKYPENRPRNAGEDRGSAIQAVGGETADPRSDGLAGGR